MAMTDTELSVAMATYNGQPYLSAQLESLVRQTRWPDELVVCDDGSKDGTLDTLRSFKAEAPFPIRIYENEQNLGPTKNFEKAIELCEGDLIALSDQDDVWHEEKLERSEEQLLDDPEAGLVFSNAHLVDAELEPLDRQLWEAVGFDHERRGRVRDGEAFEEIAGRNFVTGMTTVFREKYWGQVSPIPAGWIHDHWIALIISVIADVSFIDEPLVDYRIHDRNDTGVPPSGSRLQGVRAALESKPGFYRETAEMYEDARKRLRALDGDGHDFHDERKFLQGLVEHNMARARMPDSFRRRLPIVLHELKRRRYQTYSRGYGSALKDAIFST